MGLKEMKRVLSKGVRRDEKGIIKRDEKGIIKRE